VSPGPKSSRSILSAVRVVSWNINGGIPLDSVRPLRYCARESLEFFIDLLATFRADLICLQEVHFGSGHSQAQKIADALGFPHVLEIAASQSHLEPASSLGMAVLSQAPFKSSDVVGLPAPTFDLELPRLPTGELASLHARYVQIVDFLVFRVINLHLLPLRFLGGSYESMEGRAFVSAIEERLLEAVTPPAVVCGDFNLSGVPALCTRLVREWGLVDALPQSPSRPGTTERVDYILYSSSDLTAKGGKVLRVAADHFPCVTDVSPRE
jgi:endonuclease/exonuclease/phosphatase family metal-dependent hydrolase